MSGSGESPSYDLVFADPVPNQATSDDGNDMPPPPEPPNPDAQPGARPLEAEQDEPSLPPPAPPPTSEPAPRLADLPPDPEPSEFALPEPAPPEPPRSLSRPRPTVRLADPDESSPVQLPPPVPVPDAPLPLPPQTARPSPRSQQAQNFPAPIDLSFGPAGSGRPAPGSVASRALDLTARPSKSVKARAARDGVSLSNGSDELAAAVHNWWLRHRYYPEQAGLAGVEGTVVLHMQLDRYGTVKDLEVYRSSGSKWLDLAAIGSFRGAKLAITPGSEGESIALEATLDYRIVQ